MKSTLWTQTPAFSVHYKTKMQSYSKNCTQSTDSQVKIKLYSLEKKAAKKNMISQAQNYDCE